MRRDYETRIPISVEVLDNDETAELLLVPSRLDAAMLRATQESTEQVYQASLRTINRDTGRTAGTVHRDVRSGPGGEVVGRVYSDDKVAVILEKGSKPHEIAPTEDRLAAYAAARASGAEVHHPTLRFRVGGRVIYRRRVDHPGTRAYRWLERAGKTQTGAVKRTYDREVGDVLD